MKFVIQRVDEASVIINDKISASISKGLLVFVGFKVGDNNQLFEYYINKIINMRIFNDVNKNMNLSLLDIKGSILLVSQFTLLANTKKGNRPSYIESEEYTVAERLYDDLVNFFKNFEINIEKGTFGADMKLDFVNNGPVTILLGD